MLRRMRVLILAGGGGTRLWPLSREEIPKQFLSLTGGLSLLQNTIKRLLPICGPENIKIVAGERWDSQIAYQASELGLTGDIMVPEPCGKNTAPAIALGLAAFKSCGAEENDPILVCPSDHLIDDEEAFSESVEIGLEAVKLGRLVTFGIVPTSPETGFGYIRKGYDMEGWSEVSGFVEKPDRSAAEKYLKSGNYLWNGGIFLFRLGDMERAIYRYLPELGRLMERGYGAVMENFEGLSSISIDYGVIEKASNVAVVPMDAGWSDLGSWDAIYDRGQKDEDGNVERGNNLLFGCRGCMILGDRRLIVASDLKDITVVDTADATYIAPRGTSQNVRDITLRLKMENRRELWQAPQSARRWGEYKILHEGDGVKVKKITVHPGKSLSLQYHHHRTEHWIVVNGTAEVVRGGENFYLHEGESTFIQKDQLHRLSNPGKIPLEVIEVQNGSYLGEDDIFRVEE